MQGSYACSLSTQLSAEWERTFHILVWFSLNFFKAIKENLIILNSELYEKKTTTQKQMHHLNVLRRGSESVG